MNIEPRESRSDKLHFAIGLAASVIILAVIAWPMVAGKLYTLDDLGNMHIPYRFFFAKCLADGSSPLWFPNVFCGYYLHGEGQVGMYHPLHRFLYTHLPFEQAFDFELFITYPVMLGGVYVFLRRWQLARGAAVFGAMLFTFSGFNLLHFMHMHCIAIIAQMPWLLVAVDMSLRGAAQERLFGNFLVTLLTASQILLGHMQFVWFSSFAELTYALFLVRQWRIGSALLLAAAKALGLVVASVQLVPSAQTFLVSARNAATYSSSMLSLPPANLIQLVAPYVFRDRIVMLPGEATQEYGVYCGAVTLVLFVWAVLAGFRKGRADGLAKWAFVLAVISLVLTLGRYGGLYPLLSRLPFVGWFRAPCRYVVLTQFAMSVMSAVAFSRMASGERFHRGAYVLALPVLGLAALGAAGLMPVPGILRSDYLAAHKAVGVLVWAGPVLLAAAALLVIAAARGSRAALAALVLLAASDQAFYGLSFVRSFPAQTLEELAATVRLPDCPSDERIDIYPTTDDIATLAGHRLVGGFVGLEPAKMLDYTDVKVLRLASTAYRILKHDPAEGKGVASGGGLTLERIDRPLARARLVSTYMILQAPVSSISLAGIDIDTTAIAIAPEKLPGLRAPALPGNKVSIDLDVPGHIRVTIRDAATEMLVISESYHEGWKAFLDGRPVPVLRAYGDFLGVQVGAGNRTVDLVFAPDSLRRARGMSLAGLTIACLWCLAGTAMLTLRARRAARQG